MKNYIPYIENARRIARTAIRPMNIYRIILYRRVDDTLRRHVGEESALVFVFGVYDKKIHCIRIDDMKPASFFTWLRALVNIRPGLNIDNIRQLEEILIYEVDRSGTRIFERYVKPSPLVYKNKKDEFYRTYMIEGIKYAMIVNLKKSLLNLYYG